MTTNPTSSPATPPVDNLAIWKKVEQTDPSATSQFNRAGGFSGTAINPTWQYKVMTALFGPCGIGWGYEVTDERMVPGHTKIGVNEKGVEIWRMTTMIHQVRIRFWYRAAPESVGTIESFGVTTMVGENKNGPFTDEEAPKKSLTDALTGALQKLGVSADIFLRYWNDNKYVAYRTQVENAGKGTVDTLAGSTAPEPKKLEHKAGELAEVKKIEQAHTDWATGHRAKIEGAESWAALSPLLDEVATRPDLPEALKLMLRATASAKISMLGPKPKEGATA